MTATTPMFEQYHALKEQQPDALLLFRMGDFYELFFDDAVLASQVLEITLTSRNRSDPNPIPMAGVPHHSVSSYIEKLTEAGHRVAIADQVEDPASAKGLVKRAIVRVVTPGVTFDPTALVAHRSRWLAAVGQRRGRYGLAFLEVSTGDLRVTEAEHAEAAAEELTRLEPREVLLGPGIDALALGAALGGVTVSDVDEAVWKPREAQQRLCEALGVPRLEALGLDAKAVTVASAAAVLAYAQAQLGGALGNVHRLHVYHPDRFMVVDEATRRNLELTRTLIGQRRRGSLIGLLDRTATPMGSRRLTDWLLYPLVDQPRIEQRQQAVAALLANSDARGRLREALTPVADIERIGARVVQGSAHARDLAGLRSSLQAVPAVLAVAREVRDGVLAVLPDETVDACQDVADDLERWLVDEPPQSLTEGGLIRPEADPELAELNRLALDGLAIISELEARERDTTGIASLKIKRNRVFGYFIEVTAAHLHKVPERYLRKQTLSSCERYITPELKELEEKVLGADERRKQLELQRFRELRGRVAEASSRLLALASYLATLDVLLGLADIAGRHRWVRPTVDQGPGLHIRGGRHPMVEAALDGDRFVPNDVWLDADQRRLIVLTGPNMSGKSTVLRQTAIITLLAQMGSFVPAQEATIGLCDRIFTRVGAADDLRKGQSTFMVEMSETAAILHHATDRSLVVLDEIGRGTSTYDGLSLAWAVAEDLVERIRCRAMFATHYHELCELAERVPVVVNQSVAVTELDGEILFLRRLKDGGASRSYGIQCARLAGVPGPVLQRAQALLTKFEKDAGAVGPQAQLGLFQAAAEVEDKDEETTAADVVTARLAGIDPDELTPRRAHELLYELTELVK